MQKVCLSLIFMSALAYGAHEKKESPNNASALKVDVLQQLKTKRPVEQDVRTRYNIPKQIPSYGGKQLEVNLSQLAHASRALGGIALTCYAGYWRPSTTTEDYNLFKDAQHTYDAFLLMLLFTTFCTTYSSYAYLNGEQKNPFDIVDAPETTSTEESN